MQPALGRRVADGRAGRPGEAGGERLGATVTNSILGGRRERGSQEEPGDTDYPGKESGLSHAQNPVPGGYGSSLNQFLKKKFFSIRAIMNVYT